MTQQELKDRSRLIVALGLQRAYRGQRARARVSLILWSRFESAAVTLQRAYRRWRDEKRIDVALVRALDRKVFRRCKRSSPQVQRLKLKKDVENQPPTSVLFHKCLRGVSTHDGKMAIWRAILELRRGHPHWSTHVAFKAMIEARGDLTRALTLMSDETFALKNEGDVPMQLQLLFIPSLPGVTPVAPAKGGSDAATPGRAVSPIGLTASLSGAAAGTATQSTQFAGTGFAGLRTMQGLRAASQRNNALDFSQLLIRSYFSKFFAANIHIGTVPCKKPQGFDPHVLTPKSPNADGTVLTWDGVRGSAAMSAGLGITGVLGASTQNQTGSGSATPSRRMVSSPILREGRPAMGSVSPGHFPLGDGTHTTGGGGGGGGGSVRIPIGTPSRDTELLNNLLQLQQKMDALR